MELLKNLKVLDKRIEFKVNKAPQSDPLHSSLVLLADKSYGPAEGQKKKKKRTNLQQIESIQIPPHLFQLPTNLADNKYCLWCSGLKATNWFSVSKATDGSS